MRNWAKSGNFENDVFGHLAVENPFLMAGLITALVRSFCPRAVHSGCWLIPSLGSDDVLFILSGSAGRNDGVVCQSDSLGLLYSCLFLHKCAMLNSRICLCILTPVPSGWQIGRAGEPSLSEEMSRRSADRIWARAALSCTFILLRFWDFLTLNC